MQFERTSIVLIRSLTSALAFFLPRRPQMGRAVLCCLFGDIRRWRMMITNGIRA